METTEREELESMACMEVQADWRAGKAARSSLSKAEYLDSADQSFLEKNAKGDQEPRSFC